LRETIPVPRNARPLIGSHSAKKTPGRFAKDAVVGATVLTVRTDVPLPFATDAGLNEQVAGRETAGVMLQARLTAPLNPLAGVIVTVEVADEPAATEAGVSAVAAMPKSGTGGAVTARLRTVL
jgi:hypothetical protein